MIYYNLFSSCSLTKGSNSSCLFDLDKSTYCSIPNELFDILKQKVNILISDLNKNYSSDDINTIQDYLNFFIDNKFIYTSRVKQISSYDIDEDKFYSSYDIEDLIIDINNIKDLYSVFENDRIPNLIETIQIRLFVDISYYELNCIISFLYSKGIINVEILLRYNVLFSEDEYIKIFKEYDIISKLVIMGAPKNKYLVNQNVIQIQTALSNNKQCGVVSENLFSPNIRTFLSSKSNNSCLNRKISIDVNGDIKNCPSMTFSYGNIKDTSLNEVIIRDDFKNLWSITKDQIDVCRDCEYRYICTDCRAYLETPNDKYSKPLKCGYDPYTGEWSEWSTSTVKGKAIDHYDMQELVELNEKL